MAFNLKKTTVLWDVPLCCCCGWHPPQKDQHLLEWDCPHYQFPMAQDSPTSRRGKNINASSGHPKLKAALLSPMSQESRRKQLTQLLAVPSASGL